MRIYAIVAAAFIVCAYLTYLGVSWIRSEAIAWFFVGLITALMGAVSCAFIVFMTWDLIKTDLYKRKFSKC